MSYSTHDLLALALAVSFAAGLNVYAVVATLGLLAQTDVVELPQSIAVIESWWVIGASLALYALEFIADKIPFVDLAWNVLQVPVRVPVAAMLAFAATDRLPIELQLVAAVAGSVAALAAASGKLALRGTVTGSPEPFSNIVLSLGEDVFAIGLTWFALEYPWLAATIALAAVIVIVLLMRIVVGAVRRVVGGARQQLARRP
jgi:hypothetical protein